MKEYLDSRFRVIDDLRLYLDSKFDALDVSTKVAYNAMEKRLEGMNEFRQAMADQSNTFVTRSEISQFTDRVNADLRMLRESKAELQGKASQLSVNIALFLSVAGIGISLIKLILDK
jgi:hypothetical protein